MRAYTNPETAEERTRLAAEASEGEAPIDESVPDDVDFAVSEAVEAGKETAESVEAAVEALPEADEDVEDAEPWEAEQDEEPWDVEDDDSDADKTGD